MARCRGGSRTAPTRATVPYAKGAHKGRPYNPSAIPLRQNPPQSNSSRRSDATSSGVSGGVTTARRTPVRRLLGTRARRALRYSARLSAWIGRPTRPMVQPSPPAFYQRQPPRCRRMVGRSSSPTPPTELPDLRRRNASRRTNSQRSKYSRAASGVSRSGSTLTATKRTDAVSSPSGDLDVAHVGWSRWGRRRGRWV